MDYRTKFPYVNAYYRTGRDKETVPRNYGRYRTYEIQDRIINPSKNKNCFATVQRFKDSIIPNDNEKEIHYCGLFFDFDGKLEDSLKDTISVATFLRGFGIEETHIRVWFSGCKGFHILVHPEAMAIKESRHLTYIMKMIAEELIEMLDLTTLDLKVYSMPRMWRIPNSLHQASGLFKIELYHNELHRGIEFIKNLAKDPREPIYENIEYENITPESEAVQFWQKALKRYENREDMRNCSPSEKIIETKEWPVCIKDILDNGLKVDGTRNKATMALAGYFKDTGFDAKRCEELLLKWVETKIPEVPHKQRERIANTKAVVKSVYRSERSHFSCKYIRSLSGGEKNKAVACSERTPEGCETIQNNPEGQRPAKIPRLPLSKASEAIYIGTKVSIPVMITGKADSPFVFPKKVQILCTPNEESSICQNCALVEKGGRVEIAFDSQDQFIVDLISCANFRRNSSIRRYAGIPGRCYSNRVEILEYGNIEEVRLQPDIVNAGVFDSRPGVGKSSLDPIDEGRYCTRLAYFVGHDIEINRKYDILAGVMGHPQNQKVCHIFEQAEASQDDIGKFQMNKEMYYRLRVFRPAPSQSVREKFTEIHDDLEDNVHMIWGRREVAIAVDLAYHSILGFQFQGKWEKKGWIELLILGDSGNGKTKLVEGMMNHYQLGEITGVEGGKRTGLIWANHNIGGRLMLTWGKIPQNDKRLIVLDEFSGMPDEEVASMTRLRTEGIAESQGINSSLTTARTRMIFLTNAKNGKPLSSYNFGIEAINRLFKEHQDVRRVDLAVCVKSGDVPLEVINRQHTPDDSTHAYTTDLCKKLVLWAWSRDPRQVRFSPEAEKTILETAIRLGRKYRCDIVLVEPSDQRLKLARLACSVAARMFSTDESGELLLVEKEHVQYASSFVEKCYDAPAMEYDVYAKNKQSKMFMSDKQRSELKEYWGSLDNEEVLRELLIDGNYFRKGELADQSGMTKDETRNLIAYLTKKFLISSTPNGYKKTPMFTAFLKEYDKIDSTDPPF